MMSGLLYRVGIIVIAAGLAWAVVANTMANVVAGPAPGVALWFWPSHALGHARFADDLITASPQHPDFAQAGGEAVASMRTSPVLAAPVRLLALRYLVAGDERRAASLFAYGNALSRRDIPTQLWLLEREVAQNHIERALDHYGIVLNVQPQMQDILFPILTGALSHPDLALPIARLAVHGDAWRSDFVYFVGEHAENPAVAGNFLIALASLGDTPQTDQIQRPLGRLLNARNYVGAALLYRLADPRWHLGDPPSQIDGGFDRGSDLPPLGWEYNRTLAWRGARADDQTNQALHANLGNGNATWIARRQLVIPAGQYRIEGAYGLSDRAAQGTLRISLACAPEGNDASAASVPLRSASGRFSIVVGIANCPAPWLILSLEGGETSPPSQAWFDDLRLSAAG